LSAEMKAAHWAELMEHQLAERWVASRVGLTVACWVGHSVDHLADWWVEMRAAWSVAKWAAEWVVD